MPFSGAGSTQSVEASKWLIENQPVKIQINGHWPTLGVRGNTYTHARIPKLTPATVPGPCEPVADNSDVATQAKFTFVNYSTRVQVCMEDEDLNRNPNLIAPLEIELGKIKLEYGFFARMDTTTGVPETGGLPDLVAPGNVLNVSGLPLSFPCLEQAFNLITANNGRPTVIMSNTRSQESYRNLCWAAGIEPPLMPWRWYDPFKGWVSGWVTSFHGVPWLINDMMDQDPLPGNRRIYFMVLGDDGGRGPTRGLVRICPADLLRNPYILRMTNGVPDFGNQVVNMTRDLWLTMPAGLALGSQGALSILQNFDHVGVCGG